MMGETLSWEDGKEVMQSTTNVLMMVTPLKYDIKIPGLSPLMQKGVNWGAGSGTKTIIKNGVENAMDED